jgi:predicted RNA-binding Zn-ribbon protein involved in translation (DUF1610 family)
MYEVDCHSCHETVEFGTQAPYVCPHCGAPLWIEWRAEEKERSSNAKL